LIDKPAFLRLHHKLLSYINYWMQGVELIIRVEKLILKKRGIIDCDYCRSPAFRLDDIELAQIDQFLSEFSAWLQ
jgi:dihydrodipicolinate synthase/N-acetylneuraminate lyase